MPTFYSTLAPIDKDDTSLRNIVGSFELQVLPSNIAQITNTPNEDVLCRGSEKQWEDIEVTEEELAEVLTGKRNVHVRDIHTSHLLTNVRAVYSVVQNTVLPQSGNTDVMTKVDQMVMFGLMTRRRINLVRLILDFILSTVNTERRRHATLPYNMFLT